MSDFVEPTVLVRLVREPYKDPTAPRNGIQLEQGEYNGHPTFTLREVWEPERDSGDWRWSATRPSSNGKYWSRIGLKAKELQALSDALHEAAETLSRGAPHKPTQHTDLPKAATYPGKTLAPVVADPSYNPDDDSVPF